MMKHDLDQPMQRPARQFVKVAPPTVHAGVGNALREAFRIDGDLRRTDGFDDLLRQMA